MRHRHPYAPRRTVAEPVFVDRSGRRRRLVVAVGSAVAVALLTGLAIVVVGFSGGVPVRVPGWPEAGMRSAGPQVTRPSPPIRPAARTTPVAPERIRAAATPAATGTPAAPAAPTATPFTRPTHGNGHGRPTDKPTKSPGKPA